jgi:hypothetical protein
LYDPRLINTAEQRADAFVASFALQGQPNLSVGAIEESDAIFVLKPADPFTDGSQRQVQLRASGGKTAGSVRLHEGYQSLQVSHLFIN